MLRAQLYNTLPQVQHPSRFQCSSGNCLHARLTAHICTHVARMTTSRHVTPCDMHSQLLPRRARDVRELLAVLHRPGDQPPWKARSGALSSELQRSQLLASTAYQLASYNDYVHAEEHACKIKSRPQFSAQYTVTHAVYVLCRFDMATSATGYIQDRLAAHLLDIRTMQNARRRAKNGNTTPFQYQDDGAWTCKLPTDASRLFRTNFVKKCMLE